MTSETVDFWASQDLIGVILSISISSLLMVIQLRQNNKISQATLLSDVMRMIDECRADFVHYEKLQNELKSMNEKTGNYKLELETTTKLNYEDAVTSLLNKLEYYALLVNNKVIKSNFRTYFDKNLCELCKELDITDYEELNKLTKNIEKKNKSRFFVLH